MIESKQDRHFSEIISSLLRHLSVKGGPIDGNCEVVFGPGGIKVEQCKRARTTINHYNDHMCVDHAVRNVAQMITQDSPGAWKKFSFDMAYKDNNDLGKTLSVLYCVVPAEPVQCEITMSHAWIFDKDALITQGRDRVHINPRPGSFAAKSKPDDNLLLLLLPPIK